MYGVPADLDLTPFDGADLNEIGLGAYVIAFRFTSVAEVEAMRANTIWRGTSPEIMVSGAWRVIAPDGEVIDANEEPSERDAYRVHVLLGHSVVEWQVHAPRAIALVFDHGYTLRLEDDDQMYEAFTIHPGNVVV